MISMSIIIEGYDTIPIGNFFAYPTFQKKYVQYNEDDIGWQVSALWQTGLNMASTVGCIFGQLAWNQTWLSRADKPLGGLMNGYFASRFGYRTGMIVALGFLTGFIFITLFANFATVLLVSQILCGFSWGVFATVGSAYPSEVCPTYPRGI